MLRQNLCSDLWHSIVNASCSLWKPTSASLKFEHSAIARNCTSCSVTAIPCPRPKSRKVPQLRNIVNHLLQLRVRNLAVQRRDKCPRFVDVVAAECGWTQITLASLPTPAPNLRQAHTKLRPLEVRNHLLPHYCPTDPLCLLHGIRVLEPAHRLQVLSCLEEGIVVGRRRRSGAT